MTSRTAGRVRTDLLVALGGVVLMVLSFFVVPAGSDPLADCRTRVDLAISSSTEKSELMTDLVEDYKAAQRVVGGRCADEMSIHGLTSGKAKIALAAGWQLDGEVLPPAPQVWLPTSSMWLRLLEHEGKADVLAGAPLGQVTASTLVIAMPRSVNDALQKAKAPLGTWADVLELGDTGWAAYGRPEWGDFLLGRDNPDVSTSGLAATVATYHAAPGEVSAAGLDDPNVVAFVHGIESSVDLYGDEAVKFMTEIYAKEQQDRDDDAYRPYVDAVVIQEQMAYAYNCGAPGGAPDALKCDEKPDRPLSVVHPTDGTLELDHPFVTLAGATADQRAIAGDFFAFLREPAQQQAFRAFGFREPGHADRPTGELADVLGLPADQRLSLVTPPPADVLATMLDNWANVKKKVRVLLVLDVSDSMNYHIRDPDTADDPTKLEVLKPAAQQALGLLDDDDEVGLWTFASGPPRQVHPISPLGPAREALKSRIGGLRAGGNTALFGAVEAAYDAMVADVDPERINAVVLLSDGANTHPYANTTDPEAQRQALMDKLNPDGRDTSVRIFTIPYGADKVPVDILNEIAKRTKAAKRDATNPFDVGRAFVAVFQNFG